MVFLWVLCLLADRGLLKGKTIGVDATTLEANAAMRSIVRRDSGETYEGFLTDLAKQSGIATPTREDLARLDRKRKKKTSNEEWVSPSDVDARIAKMKDGTTHLAHKAEHAVDMGTGAVVAITLQAADQGDTTTMKETLAEAGETIAQLVEREAEQAPEDKPQVHVSGIEEVVADKGYHSGPAVAALKQAQVRTYIPEPKRQRRKWAGKAAEQSAVYANRRRVTGNYGKQLLKKRGELIERSFAHCYETGAMRRTHLRGRENILKRQLIHVGAFNLSLILRRMLGTGTPRELRNRHQALFFFVSVRRRGRRNVLTAISDAFRLPSSPQRAQFQFRPPLQASSKNRGFRHGLLRPKYCKALEHRNLPAEGTTLLASWQVQGCKKAYNGTPAVTCGRHHRIKHNASGYAKAASMLPHNGCSLFRYFDPTGVRSSGFSLPF